MQLEWAQLKMAGFFKVLNGISSVLGPAGWGGWGGLSAHVRNLSEPVWGDKVEALDCIFTYRLLLGRNPDKDELRQIAWKANNLTLREFLAEVSASAECRNGVGLLPAGHLMMAQLPQFRFWFNTGDRDMGVRMGFGIYEPETVQFFQDVVKPGMTCWDIGARTGYFSCLFSVLVGDAGRVASYEPMKESYELLKKNISENNFHGIVDHKNAACSDKLGTIPMVKHSHMLIVDEKDGNAVPIDCVKLDDECIPAPDVVKIDVEGHEPAVLRGMESTLRASSPIVVMELNEYWLQKNSQCSGADVVRMLNDWGYEVRLLGENEVLDHRYFRRELLDNSNIVASRNWR